MSHVLYHRYRKSQSVYLPLNQFMVSARRLLNSCLLHRKPQQERNPKKLRRSFLKSPSRNTVATIARGRTHVYLANRLENLITPLGYSIEYLSLLDLIVAFSANATQPRRHQKHHASRVAVSMFLVLFHLRRAASARASTRTTIMIVIMLKGDDKSRWPIS